MPEIPEIKTTGISINDIEIREIPMWRSSSPSGGLPAAPPVTVNIGVPIVDMPGCVEAHEQNTNRERSGIISEDDPKGVKTYCDAGVPSFNPIDYNKEELQFTGPPKAPVTKTEEPKPPTPEVKSEDVKPPAPPTENIECPTKVQQAQEPVGTLVEGFRKKVIGYELIDNTCVQITEKVPLPKQIVAGLPSGGQVVQVGGVAVIATTSALLAKPLADLLLKAVKPVVKKVIKKIAAIRGKKPPILSSGERRAEQRQMNTAVKELRSVFPRRKKKRKG
jgi:hypothetical protein